MWSLSNVKLKYLMEDYFHLNLKKFIGEGSIGSQNVKPNAGAVPSKVTKPVEARRDSLSARAATFASADNTDPYNSTGRFNLKNADG